tara:strand:+ start:650 stop:1114 length:465 start_codon:yes stop_codon:yes gene_type:complete
METTALINQAVGNGLAIKDIAKKLSIGVQSVYLWRSGKAVPAKTNYDKLKRLVQLTSGKKSNSDVDKASVSARSIEDLLKDANGNSKKNPLVVPEESGQYERITVEKESGAEEVHITPEMATALDEAHWEGFKEGLKEGITLTEEQLLRHGLTR